MRLERINNMEQYILNQGTVSLDDLAGHFQVSINTVRRDLNELLGRGHIRKVYGGVSAKTESAPLPMSVRAFRNSDEKEEIGRMAAALVNDGDTVFLDSGSTVVCMIPLLAQKHKITIVTHSLSAMYEASKYPALQTIALGGLFNHSTSSYVGISALEALSGITTTAAYMAATGVTLEHGLTNTTFFEAEIKRKVVQCSRKVILLADHSKFGNTSPITFFNFEDLHALVTDQKPPKNYMDTIKKNNIQLLCSS